MGILIFFRSLIYVLPVVPYSVPVQAITSLPQSSGHPVSDIRYARAKRKWMAFVHHSLKKSSSSSCHKRKRQLCYEAELLSSAHDCYQLKPATYDTDNPPDNHIELKMFGRILIVLSAIACALAFQSLPSSRNVLSQRQVKK